MLRLHCLITPTLFPLTPFLVCYLCMTTHALLMVCDGFGRQHAQLIDLVDPCLPPQAVCARTILLSNNCIHIVRDAFFESVSATIVGEPSPQLQRWLCAVD